VTRFPDECERSALEVSSVEDPAVWEIGAEFDKLNEAPQHDLLRHYRVGTRHINGLPDELETEQEAEALRGYAAPAAAVGRVLAGLALANAEPPPHRMVSLQSNYFISVMGHVTAQSIGHQ
jgi:hypothetical protein